MLDCIELTKEYKYKWHSLSSDGWCVEAEPESTWGQEYCQKGNGNVWREHPEREIVSDQEWNRIRTGTKEAYVETYPKKEQEFHWMEIEAQKKRQNSMSKRSQKKNHMEQKEKGTQ